MSDKIKSYYRYVDDIICLCNTRHIKMFITYLNSLSSNIKFTLEIQCYKAINYPDLTKSNVEGLSKSTKS